ncbi:Hemicentin-1-like 10, partial [Homarus americanus]
ASEWPDELRGAPPIQYSTLSGPAFLNSSSNSVSVVAGATALLPCGIRNLHNYTVSWVRGRDIRLLTSSSATYTTDTRFVAVNPSGGQQWILKIHYVRKSDAGVYLCQVSTTPPISLNVNLSVQEAIASVLPGREVYVQSGSRLEVVCQVEGCPPPALLSWTRGGQAVLTPESNTYDLAQSNGTTPISRLVLARPHATASDSGNYSCTSTCTKPINVTVHVLRGEELAAMQHHNTSAPGALPCSALACLLAAAAVLLHGCWPVSLLLLLPRPHPLPQPVPAAWRSATLLSQTLTIS